MYKEFIEIAIFKLTSFKALFEMKWLRRVLARVSSEPFFNFNVDSAFACFIKTKFFTLVNCIERIVPRFPENVLISKFPIFPTKTNVHAYYE